MTYSELLHSVKFDDLVPYIIKYHRYDDCLARYKFDDLVPYIIKHHGHDDCMAWYKTHYDILCRMTLHREEKNEATATISRYAPNHVRLKVSSLNGGLWEVALATELVIEPDVKASLEEIAACCLRETSYLGFTDAQQKSCFRDEEDDARIAKRVIDKYGKYILSKKQMLRNKSFHNNIRNKMKYYRTIPKKRRKSYCVKSSWRKWKRIIIEDEYNHIISNIGEFIEMLHQGKSVIAPPSVKVLCQKLLWGKYCHIISHRTYINDAPRRGEYLKELIVKYKAFTYARLPGAVVCLSSSSNFLVTVEEMELVKLATQGCKEVQFCVKVDESLARELMISVAFYEINYH